MNDAKYIGLDVHQATISACLTVVGEPFLLTSPFMERSYRQLAGITAEVNHQAVRRSGEYGPALC
jgi:hypothetical protein